MAKKPILCVPMFLWVISVITPMASAESLDVLASRGASVAAQNPTAIAKQWFYRFRTGNIDRSQLSDLANAQLTDRRIAQEAARLKALGTPVSFHLLRTYVIGGANAYDFLWQFKTARVVEMIAFDTAGQIAGIDFQILVKTS